VYTLAYDVLRDFEPIVLLSTIPSLIVARKSVPADDLKGFIAWMKANPDQATEGHVGIGSIGHVGGILFQNLTGTRFQQVPYRGSAPVMQALVAAQIDFGIESAVTSLPQFRAGAIKALAVAGNEAVQFTPILLLGEPGLGKTHFARRLAHALGTGFEFVSLSSLTAGWVLSGASAQWHNSRPGKIAQTLIEGEYANPVVVLDEVDKSGGDHRYDPPTRLTPQRFNLQHGAAEESLGQIAKCR
jgi:hypothetical protein